MTSHAEIETSKSVARQTISSALQDNSFRTVILHDIFDNGFEDSSVRAIVDTITEREVDGVVFSRPYTHVAKLASSGKIFAVFVERYRHHTIRGIEGFFDTVSVVDVDVNIQNPLLVAKKLQYAKYNIYVVLISSTFVRGWTKS